MDKTLAEEMLGAMEGFTGDLEKGKPIFYACQYCHGNYDFKKVSDEGVANAICFCSDSCCRSHLTKYGFPKICCESVLPDGEIECNLRTD